MIHMLVVAAKLLINRCRTVFASITAHRSGTLAVRQMIVKEFGNGHLVDSVQT